MLVLFGLYLLVESVAGDGPRLELDGVDARALGIFWRLQLHPAERRIVPNMGTSVQTLLLCLQTRGMCQLRNTSSPPWSSFLVCSIDLSTRARPRCYLECVPIAVQQEQFGAVQCGALRCNRAPRFRLRDWSAPIQLHPTSLFCTRP